MASTIEDELANKFPRFRDGDVLIVISPVRLYTLHRDVLRRNSTLFNRLLRTEGPLLSKKRVKAGQLVRFRLVLLEIDGRNTFTRVELNSEGQAIDGSTIGSANENGKTVPKSYEYYHKFFEYLYDGELKLDDESLITLLHDAVGMTTVAETLGSVYILLPPRYQLRIFG